MSIAGRNTRLDNSSPAIRPVDSRELYERSVIESHSLVLLR